MLNINVTITNSLSFNYNKK